MKINIILILLLLVFHNFVFASPNDPDYLNEAVVVARVESFTISGYLNCSFECYLDMNYSKFTEEPSLFFQVGTKEQPGKFISKELDKTYLASLNIEQIFNENNYKLKINFGEIKVKDNFIARLIIVENGEVRIVPLKASNYKDSITKMNNIDKNLCKAEQFLRKIQFDRLYDVDYFEDVVSSK